MIGTLTATKLIALDVEHGESNIEFDETSSMYLADS